jgi:hypothetical protein
MGQAWAVSGTLPSRRLGAKGAVGRRARGWSGKRRIPAQWKRSTLSTARSGGYTLRARPYVAGQMSATALGLPTWGPWA